MTSELKYWLMTGMVCASLAVLTACLHSHEPSAAMIDTEPTQPTWLTTLIEQAQTQPTVVIRAIYQLHDQGQTYYLTVPGCCDRLSILYNEKGQEICAPAGGFTGRGDGQCGDLDIRLLPKTQVWPKKSD